jgi:hypothetical protein
MKFGNLEIVQSSKYSQEPGNLSKYGKFQKKSLQIWRIWGIFSPKHPLYEWQPHLFFLSPCGKI